MIDIMNVTIPKKIVSVLYNNSDLKIVSSSVGQKTIITPDLKKLTDKDKSLQLDISQNYPFKIVTLVTEDSSSLIYSPSLQTSPTASQSYYVPLYAERYVSGFILALTREFSEFTVQKTTDNLL